MHVQDFLFNDIIEHNFYIKLLFNKIFSWITYWWILKVVFPFNFNYKLKVFIIILVKLSSRPNCETFVLKTLLNSIGDSTNILFSVCVNIKIKFNDYSNEFIFSALIFSKNKKKPFFYIFSYTISYIFVCHYKKRKHFSA